MKYSTLRFALLGMAFSLFFLTFSCSKDSTGDPTPDPMEDNMDEEDNMDDDDNDDDGMDDSGDSTMAAVIWTGDDVTFAKASDADPTDSANQDRLTDNVWITRGNNGGQIYNIKTETTANKGSSPAGTEWAEGSLDDWESLTYEPFRSAVGNPKNVAGKDLVVHLIEDDIYLQVRFTSWAQGMAGGFSYVRSSPE